jgi:iron(III) transport system ATP-binding protein
MIVVDCVSKSYGQVKVLDQVSFEIPAQGLVCILGPSGSGKTTLLRLIAGLDVPDEGEIHINGSLVSKAGWALAPHERGLGFMFQTPALWPHMSVAQNVMFGLSRLPKQEAHARLEQILAYTLMTPLAGRYPHQLSGGEARRAALARTLAPVPACLLLDEPLTNLDPETKGELLKLINETVYLTRACLLYVTHDVSEANGISKHLLILNRGRLHAENPCCDHGQRSQGGGL